MEDKTDALVALCKIIVRDAVPVTERGAQCFVPRYQLDKLGQLLKSLPSDEVSDG